MGPTNNSMTVNAKGKQVDKKKRTPVQKTGAAFVDALGAAAVEKLKVKLGLNTETKYTDFVSAATLTNTTAAMFNTCSTAIPQSLTDNGREGSTVRVTSQKYKFHIANSSGNTNGNTCVRMIGVRWAPTVTTNVQGDYADILENAGATGTAELLAQYTADPSYAHSVIYDRTFVLGAYANGANPNVYLVEHEYSPSDFHLRWTTADTAGTAGNSIGDIVYWYALANAATVANYPVISYYQRVEYVDN
jgi:hypothetical protein